MPSYLQLILWPVPSRGGSVWLIRVGNRRSGAERSSGWSEDPWQRRTPSPGCWGWWATGARVSSQSVEWAWQWPCDTAGGTVCGASLITARLAATAFHCVTGRTNRNRACDHRSRLLQIEIISFSANQHFMHFAVSRYVDWIWIVKVCFLVTESGTWCWERTMTRRTGTTATPPDRRSQLSTPWRRPTPDTSRMTHSHTTSPCWCSSSRLTSAP